MATTQAELTRKQTKLTTGQTELMEKLSVLLFETSQLNQAFQLWRSYVEQGTGPDWMVVAIGITYDALITFCLETISALIPATSRAGQIQYDEPSGGASRVRLPPLADPALVLTPVTQRNQIVGVLSTDPAELMEKLSVLEFETAQLNEAYQRWMSYVEQGRAPDWMVAAIRTTYDALITLCLDTISALAPATSHAGENECYEPSVETAPQLVRALLARDSMAAMCLRQPLQSDDAETDPRFAAPVDHSLVLAPLTLQNPISGELTILADVPRAFSARRVLAQLTAAAREISAMLGAESRTAEPELLPMAEPEWYGPEMSAAMSPPSTSDTISEPPAIQQGHERCNCRECARARGEEVGAEISGILDEESTIAEQSELLPMTEPVWSRPEMPVAISPPWTGDIVSEQPAIQQGQQEEEVRVQLAAIRIPATLANWLEGSSTARLFVAVSVGILIAVGGAMGIYMVSVQRAEPMPAMLVVQNSAPQAAAGALAIPTTDKAAFKFDPDPVVTPLGRSFVLNAVLSRGSDLASMAVQIDYDASILQFKGVSEGKFLSKHGEKVVLAHHDDPSTGVLKISAEQSPGNPGISGDGPVFALSFQARKRGNATVSIVPGAHDSQGQRIEMAGSQVSVRVN